MGLVHRADPIDDFDGERGEADGMARAAARSIDGGRVDVRDAHGRMVAVYRSGRPVVRVRYVGDAR